MPTITGTSGRDSLTGTDGDDLIFGGEGQDVLSGAAGDDVLDGGTGGELPPGGFNGVVFNGGDFADYRLAPNAVTVSLSLTAAQVTGWGSDTLANIESLYGSGFDDILTGNAERNALVGGAGNDRLFGLAGDDQLMGEGGDDRLDGGDGLDYLVGGDGADLITGGSGNDNLEGKDGSDAIVGGDGSDIMNGGMGADTMTSGAGQDLFFYLAVAESQVATGTDTITDFQTRFDRLDLGVLTLTSISLVNLGVSTYLFADGPTGAFQLLILDREIAASDIRYSGNFGIFRLGGDLNDALRGTTRADPIVGNGGNDVITGGEGADAISGGAGNDFYRYESPADSNQGGFDNLYDFTTGEDVIDLTAMAALTVTVNSISIIRSDNGSSFVFAETSWGSFLTTAAFRAVNASDISYTGTFGVYMIGSANGETLIGTTRNDPLDGGGGDDVLIGGTGADGLVGGAGTDVFRYVSAADSTLAAGGADIIRDLVSGIDKIDLRQVRTGAGDSFGIAYIDTSSFLFVDLGGDGTNDMLIQLTNVRLTASDILWSPASGSLEPAVKNVPEILPIEEDQGWAAIFDGGTSGVMRSLEPIADARAGHGMDWYL